MYRELHKLSLKPTQYKDHPEIKTTLRLSKKIRVKRK